MNLFLISILALPLGLQALAMVFDEFYFHRKRGLPKWERLGHPIDTFFVLLSLGVPLCFPFERSSLMIFVGLALFLLARRKAFLNNMDSKWHPRLVGHSNLQTTFRYIEQDAQAQKNLVNIIYQNVR